MGMHSGNLVQLQFLAMCCQSSFDQTVTPCKTHSRDIHRISFGGLEFRKIGLLITNTVLFYSLTSQACLQWPVGVWAYQQLLKPPSSCLQPQETRQLPMEKRYQNASISLFAIITSLISYAVYGETVRQPSMQHMSGIFALAISKWENTSHYQNDLA